MRYFLEYSVALVIIFSAVAEQTSDGWRAEFEKGIKHHAAGQWTEAERSYLSALSAARSRQPDSRPPAILENLSSLYMTRGQFARASPYLKEAIEVRTSSVDSQSNPQLVTDWNLLGAAYCALGQATDAIDAHRRALELLGNKGEASVAGSVTYFLLGMAHDRQTRLAEAEKDYQHALSIMSYSGDRDDLTFVRIATALASLYVDLYRLDEAHELLRRAVAVIQQPGNRNTLAFVECFDVWGQLLSQEEKYTAAEEAWRTAIGTRNPATELLRFPARIHLAEFYIKMAEYTKAEVELRDSADACSRFGSKNGMLYARILADLAFVKMQSHDYSKASDLLDRAQRIEESQPESLFRAQVLNFQGVLFQSRKQWSEAEGRLREVCEIRRRLLGANPLLAISMRSHAFVLRKLKRNAEAKELEQQAKAILRHQQPQQIASYTVDVRALRRQQ